jgi:hypothetical protein
VGAADQLLLFACVASASLWMATLAAAWYRRWGYDLLYRRRFDSSYRPSCAVLVPCKGASDDLAAALRGFLQLDYPEYRVFFSVESADDPACGPIRQIAAEDPRASLVVSRLATRCSQMNQNLLAAVAAAGAPDVYVFADAHLRPRPDFLRELVLPLSDPGVTASTGFRWPLPGKSNAGQLAHVYSYLFLYAIFAFSCLLSSVGLWGGAMALRRRDFIELGVAELWARTSTPDMSLSRRIVGARRKAVLVPPCVVPSDDLIESPARAVSWFERQCMYLKAHYRFIWALVTVPAALLFALQLWLPVALLWWAVGGAPLRLTGGAAALAWLGGEMVNTALFALLGPIEGKWRLLLWSPLLRTVPILGLARTLLTSTISWSGVRYRLGRAGTVASVDRG